MENAVLTPFGREIKKRLIDLDKPQYWLIEKVAESCDFVLFSLMATPRPNQSRLKNGDSGGGRLQ